MQSHILPYYHVRPKPKSSSATYSPTPLAYVAPSVWESKSYTHIKQSYNAIHLNSYSFGKQKEAILPALEHIIVRL
jgi:hypothetical protein